MKLKPLFVTVIVLAALSVAAHFLTRLPPSPSADPRVGQPVVDRAAFEKAAELRLDANGATIRLVRQPDASWRIASYYDLPANFDYLGRLVNELTAAKIMRFVTASPDRLARLDLGLEKIALLDSSGREQWSLVIGKSADEGGSFIRFGDEPKAYLAKLDAWSDTAAKDWADSTLLDLKPADIAGFEIGFDAAPPLTVSRTQAGASFAANPTPPGRQLAAGKIDSLLSSLARLRFTDTTDPTDPNAIAAKQHARTFKLTTFEGKVYTLVLGRKPEEKTSQPAVEKSAAGAPAKPASAAQAAESQISNLKSQITTSPAGPVFAFISSSDASAPVNALMKKRACQISKFTYADLPQNPGDLLTPAPKPPVPAPAATPATHSK
jgi:hypothetical protein